MQAPQGQPYGQPPYTPQTYAQPPYALPPQGPNPQAWHPGPAAVAGAALVASPAAVVAGVPAPHDGANARAVVSGEHWPLPEALLARLPQLPADNDPQLHDAQVPFSGSGSAIDWLTYAAQVHEGDNEAERVKKQLFTWAIVCLIGGFLTIWFLGLGLIPIGVSIYLFVRRKKLDKIDVDDRRLEVFTGLVRTLAPELKPKKPITVHLDFTGHNRHVRSAGRDASEYEQQWLSLKLPLQDGTHALVSVTLQVKERLKRKSKYTKVKLRQREQVFVRLTPAPGKAFKPNARANQVAGRVVSRLTLRQARVEPHQACFTWTSWISVKMRVRGGWVPYAPPPFDSSHLVSTLIVSYKLTRAAELGAA